MEKQVLIKTHNITKKFPGVVALDDVSFEIRKQEVLAIVGENGAGKSTLMNILSGVYSPTSGTIDFEQEINICFKDPLAAQNRGVAMIHQELSVAPKLSVMENIFIGRLKKNKFGFVDYKKMEMQCKQQLERLGNTTIKPNQQVSELSVSERQLIEIAKALQLNAKLIIMDEPTSSLSQTESEKLFEIIEQLKKESVSVLFISHKMDEVFAIADRIAVFRDGKFVKTIEKKDINPEAIIELMVGREFSHNYERESVAIENEIVLETKDLCSSKLKNINFKLFKQEVVVITGLVGAGRTELIQTLFGIDKYNSGKIFIDGQEVKIKNPVDAKKMQIGLVPEGRKLTGLFLNMSVKENITLCEMKKYATAGFINKKNDVLKANEIKNKLAVKTPNLEQKIKFLSGGNQQKCIIGRWLLTNAKILFLDEPTHGIDVGAKSEIYKIIDELAKSGVSLVIVSSELPEALALADRIVVMKKGEITAEFSRSEADQGKIMQFAVDF